MITTQSYAFLVEFYVPGAAQPLVVDMAHAGPQGHLIEPSQPMNANFNPPSIFSAPLPSGSGARALGMAGAFTALADDATAASWNPSGLTQLELPEFSYVLRYHYEKQTHYSGDDNFEVGEDDFDTLRLNYFSVAYPFRIKKKNSVISLNYQEVYDFEQQFNASMKTFQQNVSSENQQGVYTDTLEYNLSIIDGSSVVTTYETTQTKTEIHQFFDQQLLSSIEFHQEGVIDAISPAFAIDITPRLSAGLTVNFFHGNLLSGDPIENWTTVNYEGYSLSQSSIETERHTTLQSYYDSTHFLTNQMSNYIYHTTGEAIINKPEISEMESQSSSQHYYISGTYEEHNQFEDLRGINATFGMMYAANSFLSLGVVVDLPWTANATMEKTITHRAKTYDQQSGRLLSEENISTTDRRDIEYTFPLYWSSGATLKWNPRLFSTLDISRTYWSDFSFKADGEDRVNPINGAPTNESKVDDCWEIRVGTEYLFVFPKTEIPVRIGGAWEQQPATGSPDEYWRVSCGTGVSFEAGSAKCIFDIAYTYRWGNDVLGSLIPTRDDMTTDVEVHEVYLSNIWHF